MRLNQARGRILITLGLIAVTTAACPFRPDLVTGIFGRIFSCALSLGGGHNPIPADRGYAVKLLIPEPNVPHTLAAYTEKRGDGRYRWAYRWPAPEVTFLLNDYFVFWGVWQGTTLPDPTYSDGRPIVMNGENVHENFALATRSELSMDKSLIFRDPQFNSYRLEEWKFGMIMAQEGRVKIVDPDTGVESTFSRENSATEVSFKFVCDSGYFRMGGNDLGAPPKSLHVYTENVTYERVSALNGNVIGMRLIAAPRSSFENMNLGQYCGQTVEYLDAGGNVLVPGNVSIGDIQGFTPAGVPRFQTMENEYQWRHPDDLGLSCN